VATVISLQLYTKPGCHLCDEARMVVETVVSQFRSVHAGVAANIQVQIYEINILEDEKLLNLYGEEIPVLQINGQTHGYWRIDPIRLLAALEDVVSGS
jgi:glutaredoxin